MTRDSLLVPTLGFVLLLTSAACTVTDDPQSGFGCPDTISGIEDVGSQPLDAVFVDRELPYTIVQSCGTLTAYMCVVNAGSSTWTDDGQFKLVAGQQWDDLSDTPEVVIGEEVATQEVTKITYELLGPSPGGEYTIDWQMAQETGSGDVLFGEVLTHTMYAGGTCD